MGERERKGGVTSVTIDGLSMATESLQFYSTYFNIFSRIHKYVGRLYFAMVDVSTFISFFRE